jgi:hypothetical protein
MKKLLTTLLLGIISMPTIFAQEILVAPKDMNAFLSKNLKYPIEARINDLQGTVILQTTFDELGFPLRTTVISGDELLAAEVTRTVSALHKNWKPEYLGDRTKGDSYLMSFQFKISKDRSTTQIHQMIPKKDQELLMESTEKRLESRLEANPYNFKLYEERAELYRTLNLPVLAEKDLMLADYFKNKMLTQMVIIGYQFKDNSLSAVE